MFACIHKKSYFRSVGAKMVYTVCSFFYTSPGCFLCPFFKPFLLFWKQL